jgi:hypothetical protein
MEQRFKEGDWCFCEFELKQIVVMDGNCITSVTNGFIRSSSLDLSDRCYPLDLKVKTISDSVKYWSDKFHKIKLNINHPDLNRELINRWTDICDARFNEEKCKALMQSLDEFGKSIVEACEDLKCKEIAGVKLFR